MEGSPVPAPDSVGTNLRSTVAETDLELLGRVAREEVPLTPELGEQILGSDLPLEAVLAAGELSRRKYFSNKVRLHVLNNIKNGSCPEDCGYCAQRKTAAKDSIAAYTRKPDEEILSEAEAAYKNGAFRYCLVSAGRGPGRNGAESLARVVKKIKDTYPIEVCVSAGILTDQHSAQLLKEAGVDRYNHNLNTAEENYSNIATSHTYADRTATLDTLAGAGVGLCSGVIAGMGESASQLVAVALNLGQRKVASIPVNFFIPVPGHALPESTKFTAEDCLRILALFRLAAPASEVRVAAGRELYLQGHEAAALRVANSFFVSGYLNVKGSDARATVDTVRAAGFVPEGGVFADESETQGGEPVAAGGQNPATSATRAASLPRSDRSADAVRIKTMEDLRPFRSS